MNQLAPPFAVFGAVAECDGPGRHEAYLVTDGFKAYAEVGSVEVEAVGRSTAASSWMTFGCPAEQHGQVCTGMVDFDLSTPGTWGAHQHEIDLLVEHGKRVEQ